MIVSLEGMQGFDAMEARLGDLSRSGAGKARRAGVNASSRVMVKAMKARAPVDEGKLRKSVKGYVQKKKAAALNKAGASEKVIAPTATKPGKDGTRIRYPWVVEAKHPYIRPTFDANASQAAEAGASAMQAEVDKIWEKEFAKTFDGRR